MEKIKLRKYQGESLLAISGAIQRGIQRQVLVLATGLGKTIIFNTLASAMIKKRQKKVLIIAHREELLTQAKDKMKLIDNDLRIGIERAEQHVDEDDYDVIVASVPTIGRNGSDRIKKFDPEKFCLVIVDEAHHASAATYKNIFRYFGVLKEEEENNWNEECLLLGVTATPSRSDNQGIDTVFQEVVYEYTITEGIKGGYLAPVRAWKVQTDASLSGVKTTAGDYNQADLAAAIDIPERNAIIVDSYNQYIPNKKALVFAVDVQHTENITSAFNQVGIPATYIIGSLPSQERKDRLGAFAKGEYKIMVNCMTLTEGFDEPSIEAILMARPTKSGILYQQMVGRGTRLFDNKPYVSVIDFVDNSTNNKLQTISSLMGVEGAIDFKGRDIFEMEEKIEKIKELDPGYDLSQIDDITKLDYVIEQVDLLAGLKVPEEVEVFSHYDWYRYRADTYRLNLSEKFVIEVSENIAGKYQVIEHVPTTPGRHESRKIGSHPTLQEAIITADAYVQDQHKGSVSLVNSNAGWRKDEASDNQIRLLQTLNAPHNILSRLTKGNADRLIRKLKSR